MSDTPLEQNKPDPGRDGADRAAGEESSETVWSKARRRLEEARAALEKGFQPDADEKLAILEDRARALSWRTEREDGDDEQLVTVEFLLGHETYAIESAWIREVHPLRDLTPIPCTPPFVLGVINVHGQILSVLDLKRFFRLPEQGLTDLNRIIILSSGEMEFGILADAILGLRSIPVRKIQPPPPTLTDIKADFLRGVTGERVVIIDGKKLLSDPRIIVHEEVETV